MLKKYILTLLLLCFLISPACADIDSSYPKITRIEKQLYQKSYENEDIYNRLNRLEQSIYKEIHTQKDLSTRVDDISTMLQISAIPGYLIKDIEKMEQTNFNRSYEDENPDNRLERLEYHLIGALQEGNYKDRIYKLKNLTEQQSVAQYLDDNSGLYNSSNSTYNINSPNQRYKNNTGISNPETINGIQKLFMMVAPLIFSLI